MYPDPPQFPPYLANPPAPLEPEDRKRYESQLAVVRQIITVFDEPGYDANNPETGKKVVDLMSQVGPYEHSIFYTPRSPLMRCRVTDAILRVSAGGCYGPITAWSRIWCRWNAGTWGRLHSGMSGSTVT